MSVYSVEKLMAETRRLAVEYRCTTGKTLPVSGEPAVHDAITLPSLQPAAQDSVGHDAWRELEDRQQRIQIKCSVVFDGRKRGHRIGQLRLEPDWDVLVLVLMDEEYEPEEIYEADKEVIMQFLNETKNSSRKQRGAISVARFRIIGRLAWSRAAAEKA